MKLSCLLLAASALCVEVPLCLLREARRTFGAENIEESKCSHRYTPHYYTGPKTEEFVDFLYERSILLRDKRCSFPFKGLLRREGSEVGWSMGSCIPLDNIRELKEKYCKMGKINKEDPFNRSEYSALFFSEEKRKELMDEARRLENALASGEVYTEKIARDVADAFWRKWLYVLDYRHGD